MMDEIAISIRDISKKYRLYDNPKDRLKEVLHPRRKCYHRDFWALNGISFDIRKGQTVGIVGRNGSGKSTLLEIISGVSQPTSGSVNIKGKVSALLELGSGFNPQFTGRDNVLLNGAIMGMSREQMLERMPIIEKYAGIGEFFDQPVKIYSSGMAVRLKFAASINVDPDILIVDEALAVGDARFQQKCFETFRKFQKAGITILLVTHQPNMVINHCDEAILLDAGNNLMRGAPKDVINTYNSLLSSGRAEKSRASSRKISSASGSDDKLIESNAAVGLKFFMSDLSEEDICHKNPNYNPNEFRFGDKRAEILDYLVICNDVTNPASISSGDSIDIYYKYRFNEPINEPLFGFGIKTVDGVQVYGTNTRFGDTNIKPATAGQIGIFKFSIKMDIAPGHHFIDLGVAEKLHANDVPCEIRRALIHINVLQTSLFAGFAKIPSDQEEILRR